MTPRERVLAAIEHREPDHVPVDLGATPSSGISAIAYNRLKDHIRLDTGPTRVYDVVQQLAQPDEAILDHFGVHVLDVGRTFNTDDSSWYDVTLGDGSPARYPVWFRPEERDDGARIARAADGTPIAEKPATSMFFDQTCFPYIDDYPDTFDDLPDAMGKVMWAALVHSPWDHCGEEDFWDQLRQKALKLRAESDRALVIVAGCNLFEWGTFLRRMDNFLMDLVCDPANVERLVGALMEHHLRTLEQVCRAVGDVADLVRLGDDLGMDSGPFMSPDIYRRLFKPHHKTLCDTIKANSRMHTFLHSCGSIHALIPDLIEAGFEVLNPVQTTCKNMEPERLKREFGRDVTFWGAGCDMRRILNRASPDQVRDHVRKRVDILAPGGGFVFNTEHNILPEVPAENIVAMFQAIE